MLVSRFQVATTADRCLLIIGEPATGKSTLAEQLTQNLPFSVDKKPFWHTVYYGDDGWTIGSQLGWKPEFGEAAKFPGTDRLGNDVVGNAVKFMRGRPFVNVIVEGDRLANARFIDGLMNAGYGVEIAHVVGDPLLIAARRQQRGDQDAMWLLTRMTKVKHLIEEYRSWVNVTLDSTQLDPAGMAVERVRTKIPDEELEAKKGKILTEDDVNFLVTNDSIVRKPDGSLLLVYRKGALDGGILEQSYDVLHSLRVYESNNRGLASGTPRYKLFQDAKWAYAENRPSTIIGSFDSNPPRRYCRLTAWSGRELDKFSSLFPLFEEIGGHFERNVPDRWQNQMSKVRNTHPDWVIPRTPFTTITVNNSYPTGVHTDKGDLDEGFSTLAVLRKGSYTGGWLTFPEFRLAVDMHHGDLLLMDAHEWHGNTMLVCGVCGSNINSGLHEACGTERISVVSYFRTKMTECGPMEEEMAKAAGLTENAVDEMALEATGG
jgi:hypothetical protein